MYNHLLDALLRENLVGAVVPVQRHEEGRAHHGVVSDCRNHRVDTAHKMLGQMARIVTSRTRLAMRRLILLAEMVPMYMSLFSCSVEFRVVQLFLVFNEMV
jgi:hypothetical protein